jgi:hypothetical protein
LKIWKKSLNISINDDYQISVHIKHIKNNSESSITQQSAYFASYATKTINLSKYNLNFIESYINQIDKRNLIIYSGTMKMINNKKKLIDNNIIDNNEDNNSTYYLYKNNSYYKIDRE